MKRYIRVQKGTKRYNDYGIMLRQNWQGKIPHSKQYTFRQKFKYFYDSFQELFTIHFAEVYLIFLQGFSRPVFGPFTNISFFLGKSSGEVQYFEKLEDH